VFPTIIKADLLSLPSLVRSVTPVSPVTAIPNSQSSLPDFTQGQKYLALVEARLPNGNSRVLIADKLLQMRLPEHIQPGKQFELTLLSQEPKLRFILNTDNHQFDAIKNNTFISPTGRFLGALMQDTTKTSTKVATPQSLISTTPILTNAPTNNMELPSLLQQRISQSGLFYESHQAQWINGKNTLEKLKQEPQGRITINPTLTAATLNTLADSGIPVHSQSLSLVQQQLTTLETGHIVWRGEIWNGQPLEWEIHEEAPENNKTNETTQWKTQLRLSLPQLGDITVTIILNAQGIRVKLGATIAATAELLENNQRPLTTKMNSAGLNIQSVEVKQDAEE
jgi:flagellar hook-length control protein FliK